MLIKWQHINEAVKYWCRIRDIGVAQNTPVRNAYNMMLDLCGTGFTIVQHIQIEPFNITDRLRIK